jgi:hypothetical protein
VLAGDVWGFVVREGDRWIESSSYRESRPLLPLHLHDLIYRHHVVVCHDPERSADHLEYDQYGERQRQQVIGVSGPVVKWRKITAPAARTFLGLRTSWIVLPTGRYDDRVKSRTLFAIT